jgi:hypothetical protein
LAITLAGLKTKVLNSINEQAGKPHSDTQLTESINYAQRTVSLWLNSLNKTFLGTSSVITASPAGTFALPSDFDMAYLVLDSADNELPEISINDKGWKSGYYFTGTNLYVVPTTLTATITLYYTPILDDLTTGDSSDIPIQFEWMTVFLATAELNRRMNDFDAFRSAMEMYEREQKDMQSRVRRQTQKGGRVRDVKTLRTYADG